MYIRGGKSNFIRIKGGAINKMKGIIEKNHYKDDMIGLVDKPSHNINVLKHNLHKLKKSEYNRRKIKKYIRL